MKESYKDGVKKQETVKKPAWNALGFIDTMSLEEARARAKQLNGENTIKRGEQERIARIASRIERDRFHHSVFVPEDLNQKFLEWLDQNVSGSTKHREKILSQWVTAKKIIITLQRQITDFESNKVQFYRYIASQEYSLDYANKLIRLINLYGFFVAKLTGRFFEPIPKPRSSNKEMIADAYFNSDSYFGPSDPLTPSSLELAKTYLIESQYRWLFCTVWLGLRPSELEQIKADRQNQFWRIEEGEVDVLWVYQSKLTSKPRHLRWKPIPLVYPEQVNAKGYLFQVLSKPIAKTMRKYFSGHVTLYGGRKAFTDLMLDRGQGLEDIAQWLGHTSIEMTWTRYKDKNQVRYKKLVDTAR